VKPKLTISPLSSVTEVSRIFCYGPTKWEAYRVALVRTSVCMSVRTYVYPYVPQILWHQLLLNYQADFFQTCTDDQAGCVDDHKERIFSCDQFHQSYGPLLLQMLLQQWGHQCLRTHSSFLRVVPSRFSPQCSQLSICSAIKESFCKELAFINKSLHDCRIWKIL
jgi:hypothetical protein